MLNVESRIVPLCWIPNSTRHVIETYGERNQTGMTVRTGLVNEALCGKVVCGVSRLNVLGITNEAAP